MIMKKTCSKILFFFLLAFFSIFIAPLKAEEPKVGEKEFPTFDEVLEAKVEPIVPYKEWNDKDVGFWHNILNNIRIYVDFNARYPGKKIDEDFSSEVRKMFPHYNDHQIWEKTENIRQVIRTTRSLDSFLVKIAQKMMIPEEPPLLIENKDIAQMHHQKYIPSDKLVVIKDFKKIIPYAQDKRTFEALEALVERENRNENRFSEFGRLKNKLSQLEFAKIPLYGIIYPDPFSGKLGVGEWQKVKDVGLFRLVSDSTAVGNFGEVRVVFHAMLDNKGYWADDAKNRLSIDLSQSKNILSYKILRPVSDIIFKDGKELQVYKNQIAIPILVWAKDPTKEIKLSAKISGRYCFEKDCREVLVFPKLDLGIGERQNSTMNNFVTQTFVNLPQKNPDNLKLKKAVVDVAFSADEAPVLRVHFESDAKIQNFKYMAESSPMLNFGEPRLRLDGKEAVIHQPIYNELSDILRTEIEFTAQSGLEIPLREKISVQKSSFFDADKNILNFSLILMAFIGGLLLNIMPCVFPVLSLKIVSLSQFGGEQKAKRNFLFTFLGIMLSFLVLSFALIFVKALGQNIGWGMQFQNPFFLVVMIFVLVLFIGQIQGLFYINPPSFLNKIFSQKTSQENFMNFLTGVFLVLLATPCTAPYLGTAIGFALAGSSSDLLIIMGATALGFSMPYWLLYLNPQVSSYIPHPGEWLKHVEKAMIFFLMLTLVWLIWILAGQTGGNAALRNVFYVFLLWVILYFRKQVFYHIDTQDFQTEVKNRMRRLFNRVFNLIMLLLLFINLWDMHHAFENKKLEIQTQKAEKIDLSVVEDFLKKGHPVLIKIDANWCLTCQFNQVSVFKNYAFKLAAKDYHLEIIEVDWTNYNRNTLEFMEKFGRKGLPFYVLFTPKVPNGIVLSEMPSELEVINILKSTANR